MGHRAITNCAWSLGERTGGALGYLVGKEGSGLACMFGMMNAMRIEVGLGAACLGKRGYLESLASCMQVLTTAPSPFPTGTRRASRAYPWSLASCMQVLTTAPSPFPTGTRPITFSTAAPRLQVSSRAFDCV